MFITRKLLKLSITDKNKTMTIYKAPTKKNAPFKHVTDFTNLTTEELFASKDFTNATDALIAAALIPIDASIVSINASIAALTVSNNNKISKYDGPTYDINALVSMTAAEYAAITPDPKTIYFVI